MHLDESLAEQPSRIAPVTTATWKRTAVVVVITALLTGAGGYLLGRNKPKHAESILSAIINEWEVCCASAFLKHNSTSKKKVACARPTYSVNQKS